MHIPQTENSLGSSTRGVIRRAVVPAVLVMFFLICAGSPQDLLADPISFEITWALSAGGPAPATTTYTYDPVTGLFAGFVVAWNGASFDLTAGLNSGTLAERQAWQLAILDPADNNWAGQVAPGAMQFLFSPDLGLGISLVVLPPSPEPPPGLSLGTFTVSPAAVPEPATLTLCGISLGGLLLTRYARGRRRSQDS